MNKPLSMKKLKRADSNVSLWCRHYKINVYCVIYCHKRYLTSFNIIFNIDLTFLILTCITNKKFLWHSKNKQHKIYFKLKNILK